MGTAELVRTRAQPSCIICGSAGKPLYEDLSDRLFGAPGLWRLKLCCDSSCGLVWLDPVPHPDNIGIIYRTYYTHLVGVRRDSLLRRLYRVACDGYLRTHLGYSSGVGPWWYAVLAPLAQLDPGGWAEIEARVCYLQAQPPGARFLDVGCGSGDLMQRLREVGWKVTGVDSDPEAVAVARQRGLDVHWAELKDQAFADNYFDAIGMSHVIEHVHDPVALVRECHRVLKPGGRLIILTPNAISWGHRRFGRNWRGLEPPRHLNIFAPNNLRTVLHRAGFESISTRTEVRSARYLSFTSRLLEKNEGHAIPESPAYGGRERIRSAAYQMFMRVRLLVDSASGDEILAIVRKY